VQDTEKKLKKEKELFLPKKILAAPVRRIGAAVSLVYDTPIPTSLYAAVAAADLLLLQKGDLSEI